MFETGGHLFYVNRGECVFETGGRVFKKSTDELEEFKFKDQNIIKHSKQAGAC